MFGLVSEKRLKKQKLLCNSLRSELDELRVDRDALQELVDQLQAELSDYRLAALNRSEKARAAAQKRWHSKDE